LRSPLQPPFASVENAFFSQSSFESQTLPPVSTSPAQPRSQVDEKHSGLPPVESPDGGPRQFVILGVPFFGGSVDQAVEKTLGGGLVMLPSGPADLVLPDSGAMVLAWNFLHWRSPKAGIPRVSGLTFLRRLLERLELRAQGYTFWVMPSDGEREANISWLIAKGFRHLSNKDAYVAPNYRALQIESGEISDPALVEILEARRPQMIFLNVGSGVQEPLGAYLKSALSYRPAIICSGAAIAFLTGGQAAIPPWADRFCLGWLLRILHSPSRFGSRYWKALPLFGMLARYGEKAPRFR
jgi:UDP-N-acetyl-D-mannosaminuronic acid transferase (WecB/TagA/CpsF family)